MKRVIPFFRRLRQGLWMRSRGLSLLVVFVLGLATSAFAAPVVAPGIGPDAVMPVLQAWLAQPSASPLKPDGIDWAAVARFYEARGFEPAWIANPAANAAVAALQGSAADGLEPLEYHAPSLAARQRLTNAAEAAAYDMMLTDGMLRYARDLRMGRVDPAQADRMVGLTRGAFDPVATLSTALADGYFADWLAGLPPAHPEYARLKAALLRYRDVNAKGGWPKLPALGKIKLEPGSPALEILRRRLADEDPQMDATMPADMQALEAAVKRFQARNGLEVDGVVGRQSIAALNVSPAERVAQIEANMERWRWLPHEFGPRYIAVNAADATLKVVDQGEVVLTSRVIVGKPETPTAIFNANVIAVTFNPPWNVPDSIARNEMLPKLRRNPAYLARQHIVVVNGPAGDPYGRTINWRLVSRGSFPYQLRQTPGEGNALGYIKMEMPNAFTAYLHDTSSRELFARDERHLSHGCIRVQNIRPLASYALTGDLMAGQERMEAAIKSGETQQIALDRPLPVYVLYWTTIADVDGTVEFRRDVYGRDKRLIAAMAGQPVMDGASLGSTGCLGWVG